MNGYTLEREQWIPASLDRVWEFFSDAANLEAITPRWLHFRILTPLPIEMQRDTHVEYRLRLAGLPLRWRTRIAHWDPPHGFVDTQERGPYRSWEHRHVFEAADGGVWMLDRVHYALPFGPLGRVAHAVAVRAALAAIFDHRSACIRERFGSRWRHGSTTAAPTASGVGSPRAFELEAGRRSP